MIPFNSLFLLYSMLQKLYIKNYAIIDELVFEPDVELNTITGETGAGKSIIVGALSLILGARADTSVLINKEQKCIIEATFDVANNQRFTECLQVYELDNEPVCIIRREIGKSGKSRAFVNDTPVNLSQLNELTNYLVDLHQQFDHLTLADDEFQMNVLDAYAANQDIKENYSTAFKAFASTKSKLIELKEQEANAQKEVDYKQFLLDELVAAAFTSGEIEQAEQELKTIEHAEQIHIAMQYATQFLEEGELPVVNELRKVSQQLEKYSGIVEPLIALVERINSAQIELSDIAGELNALQADVTIDGGEMRQLQERVDIGYKLLKKHNVESTDELIAIKVELENDLKEGVDLSNQIAILESKVKVLQDSLLQYGEELSNSRRDVEGTLSKQINDLLHLVGMSNANMKIDITELSEPLPKGLDKVSFLFDANRSGAYKPMGKVASGGEMSRIMLCVKSLIAKAIQLPTLIFDEVDTGISGEAAKQVAVLLKGLSKYHQVICITHQPQIAAKGARHFYVYKSEAESGHIVTRVRLLTATERVDAIANMIGGAKPSDATIENAKELIGN